jgi:hypothetical protein
MLDNYIDFDESSREWRKNKKKKENGQFEYICNYFHTNGKQCRRTIVSNLFKNDYICGFGGYVFDKYRNHPNRNYYCKKHIRRYNPTI